MIFSTIAYYWECCKLGRKKGEKEWEATLNLREFSSFPDTCHVCMRHMFFTRKRERTVTTVQLLKRGGGGPCPKHCPINIIRQDKRVVIFGTK